MKKFNCNYGAIKTNKTTYIKKEKILYTFLTTFSFIKN
jgi:hypothetical protein